MRSPIPRKIPTKIQLHKQSQQLELHFGSEHFLLPAEFLRVYSPSAEVKGHGPGQEVLQFGKKNIALTKLERAGNYALQLTFDDGHNSGIYSWDYLYDLGKHQQQRWNDYLEKLNQAGQTREPNTSVIKFIN